MRSKMVMMGVAVFLAAGQAALPALAHHSFATEYDRTKPVTLKGTVTKVDLLNPHSWLYLNVTDDAGEVASWGIEMPPPHELAKLNVHKNTIPIGALMTVEGFLAKNGSNVINGRSLKFPDGHTVLLGGPSPDPVTLLDKSKVRSSSK